MINIWRYLKTSNIISNKLANLLSAVREECHQLGPGMDYLAKSNQAISVMHFTGAGTEKLSLQGLWDVNLVMTSYFLM
jgi:hypothetical protein